MRLTPHEIVSIRECAARRFGEGAVVRLFGSRARDDLEGGDINLHITAESADRATSRNENRFKDDLERRIGEQRVDVLVSGPDGSRRPIDKIAVLTGRVLADRGQSADAVHEPDAAMITELHRDMLRDALLSGDKARVRLHHTLSQLAPLIPFDERRVDTMDDFASVTTDSLLLQFSNMVAVVQDQLVRTILLAAGRSVAGLEKEDQFREAEALGALPIGVDFAALAKARDKVVHQYPADPHKQAAILNEVVAAVPLAIATYDSLHDYASRVLAGRDEE